MTTYPGGKNGSGVYQTIINQMPPHQIYIEAFLGGGAVMRHKLPAPVANIGIDVDAAVIDAFEGKNIPSYQLVRIDALTWMSKCLDKVHSVLHNFDTLIYLDPPYLLSTRSYRRYYRYELSDADHERLLTLITNPHLHCKVAISGYYSDMYADYLAGWRSIQYQTMTRGARPVEEWLWMNYPEPFELHDYRYLGSNYRERERIKRKKTRWQNKLRSMDPLERYAIMDAVQDLRQKDE